MPKLKVVKISRKKEKDVRDIKIWTVIVSLGTIFIFAIIVSWIARNTPDEIDFFGIAMNFHYFIFAVFVFLLGVITSFFLIRIAKLRKNNKSKR
jgi:ABC-type amino acid transport system permease subunit